jgi:diadenosine tetraphosphatase ApaH/serine/threonine PP2A family protein phosphatase
MRVFSMPYAVISDVHSNLEALEAVFADIEKRGAKEVLFLGDAVGYGPNPSECVALLNEGCQVMLAGNHDWAALGMTDISYFNAYAKAAVLWTDSVLSDGARATLKALPLGRVMEKYDAFLVHASPEAPEQWHYLIYPDDVARAMDFFDENICMVGHSHYPFLAECREGSPPAFMGKKAEFRRDARYVLNAGSVGQPRDGDPRACYLLMDEESVETVRVDYPFERTQEKMYRAGLPEPLISRLSLGR